MPTRKYHFLSSYFKTTNKDDVSFFISDMWKPFVDIGYTFFKKSSKIIDKYHYVRQVIWALEYVRKQEQQKFSKQYRIYFKRSKSLLNKKGKYLTEEQKIQVNNMLNISYALYEAYHLKEYFFEIFEQEPPEDMIKLFKEWIHYASSCSIPKFNECAKTFSNWYNEIINSFYFNYTNGFTECCNNKIKVLKRNAYGYRNFNRFRNRILHMFN